jgi:hypothetical protein
MKQKIGRIIMFISLACLMIVVFASCVTAASYRMDRSAPPDAPKKIKRAYENAPGSALVSIGSTDVNPNNSQMAPRTATARARAQIAQQLNTLSRSMDKDFHASSQMDPNALLSYQEQITVLLSQASLTGAGVIAQAEANGKYWVVIQMNRPEAVREIERARQLADAATSNLTK